MAILSSRYWCRTALALLVALCLGQVRPQAAFAHAWLLHTVPADGAVLLAPPSSLELYFSESIDLPARALQVEQPDGHLATLSHPSISATNSGEMVATFHGHESGTYVVSWKVISADSHPVWGSFRFSIGASSAVPPMAGGSESFARLALALQALGRWLNFLGASLIVGPLAIWWYVLGGASAGFAPGRRRRVWDRMVRLAGTGSLLAAAGVFVAVVAQMANLSDNWGQTFTLSSLGQVFIGQLGYVLSARVFLAVIAWGLCGVLLYLPPPPADRPLPGAARLVGGLGLVLLLSSTLVAHAATTSPAWLSIPLDWLHLLAAAIWMGGLAALVRALPALLGPPDGSPVHPSWTLLAAVVPPFSRLALGCVSALAITGLYSAVRNVGTLSQLVTTDYGRALSLKIGLTALVLAVASVNLLVLGPAIRKVAAGRTPRLADVWLFFRPLIRLECILLIAIMGAAGILAAQAPARQSGPPPAFAGGPSTTVASVTAAGPHAMFAFHSGPVLITVAIAPAAGGLSPVAVSFTGIDGQPVGGAVSILATAPPGSGAPAVLAALDPQGSGQFGGVLDLEARGRWNVRVNAHPATQPAATQTFHLTLPLRDGRALVAQADQATNELRSEMMTQEVSAGGAVVHTTWWFQAPDRMRYLARGDIETYRVGARRWDRRLGGPWQTSTLSGTDVFTWPQSRLALQAWDAEIVDSDPISGRRCWVVSFWESAPNATFTLWIDQRTNRVLREELLHPGGFEYDQYGAFNQALEIRPPS